MALLFCGLVVLLSCCSVATLYFYSVVALYERVVVSAIVLSRRVGFELFL